LTRVFSFQDPVPLQCSRQLHTTSVHRSQRKC